MATCSGVGVLAVIEEIAHITSPFELLNLEYGNECANSNFSYISIE
jgi:hypothetical protein